MNYRHGFHAGNFADVLKHALLARLLSHFLRKNARFRVLDTHAGEGAYDLFGDEAERTGEWRGGVGRLADLSAAAPEVRELLAPYIDALGPFVDGRPRLYPGSPLLAQGFLGEQGRAIFCELREDAFAALRRRFSRDKRVKTINLDGYTAAGAFVPPVERRGLVLIDPPFEQPNEFQTMFSAFHAAYRKWSTGVYVLWHPVKDFAGTKQFLDSFHEAGIRRVLRIELCVGGTSERLNRAGLVVVNPPFGFEEEARALLPFLAERLAVGPGAGFVVEEVVGE
jgi:23S rRNA (adenine2030-N6)-methyltransferase